MLMLATFGMLQQQQALAVHCVHLSAQPHHASASGSVISLRQDSDQLGFLCMLSCMIAVFLRVCLGVPLVFWLLLTGCGAADRHDAKRQDQSNGKEGDQAAGDSPDGTDLPPPPPKPKSKEKSTGKEPAPGEHLVLSVNVKTQAHKLFELACPVTLAKSCAMHRIECCCMSHFLLSSALSLCNPASICTVFCVSVCVWLTLCTCMCKRTFVLHCSCLCLSICLCI